MENHLEVVWRGACMSCQGEFYITAGEREFYAGKDMVQPRRCWSCRQARRAFRADQPEVVGRTYEPAPRPKIVC